MQITGNNFIIPNYRPKNVEYCISSGSASEVYRLDDSVGDFIEKTPTIAYRGQFEFWMDTVKYSKKITDKLRGLNNNKYFVPKTFIAGNRVFEHMMHGVLLKDFKWENVTNVDKIKYALSYANFINDFSELKPVKNKMFFGKEIRGISKEGIFLEYLSELDYILTEENYTFIKEAFRIVAKFPENKQIVFWHNDLHDKNIFVNEKNKKIGIIDFEMSDYNYKIYAMYSRKSYGKTFWDTVDALPRKKNSEFKWGFDSDKCRMYRFLESLFIDMVAWRMGLDKPHHFIGNFKYLEDINERCDKIRAVFNRLKMNKIKG